MDSSFWVPITFENIPKHKTVLVYRNDCGWLPAELTTQAAMADEWFDDHPVAAESEHGIDECPYNPNDNNWVWLSRGCGFLENDEAPTHWAACLGVDNEVLLKPSGAPTHDQ